MTSEWQVIALSERMCEEVHHLFRSRNYIYEHRSSCEADWAQDSLHIKKERKLSSPGNSRAEGRLIFSCVAHCGFSLFRLPLLGTTKCWVLLYQPLESGLCVAMCVCTKCLAWKYLQYMFAVFRSITVQNDGRRGGWGVVAGQQTQYVACGRYYTDALYKKKWSKGLIVIYMFQTWLFVHNKMMKLNSMSLVFHLSVLICVFDNRNNDVSRQYISNHSFKMVYQYGIIVHYQSFSLLKKNHSCFIRERLNISFPICGLMRKNTFLYSVKQSYSAHKSETVFHR